MKLKIALIGMAMATSIMASEKPNIIMIMSDDQGWGNIGVNGNPELKTPPLDEMAANGIKFDRFYAASPLCSPTRGYFSPPNHHGYDEWVASTSAMPTWNPNVTPKNSKRWMPAAA